ncbi:mCG1049172 [Mus musculus]|nr:mCG1049172 [Mus musculus]
MTQTAAMQSLKGRLTECQIYNRNCYKFEIGLVNIPNSSSPSRKKLIWQHGCPGKGSQPKIQAHALDCLVAIQT